MRVIYTRHTSVGPTVGEVLTCALRRIETLMKRPLATAAVGIGTALACLALPGVAHATPPSGVTAQTLEHWSFPFVPGSAEIEGTDLTIRRIEIAPGGTTGWHFHDGPVYAYVESGVLSRTLSDCSIVSTAAGNLVAEDVGGDHVHEGTNFGVVPVVLYAAYIEPPGKPFAEDAAAPSCG